MWHCRHHEVLGQGRRGTPERSREQRAQPAGCQGTTARKLRRLDATQYNVTSKQSLAKARDMHSWKIHAGLIMPRESPCKGEQAALQSSQRPSTPQAAAVARLEPHMHAHLGATADHTAVHNIELRLPLDGPARPRARHHDRAQPGAPKPPQPPESKSGLLCATQPPTCASSRVYSSITSAPSHRLTEVTSATRARANTWSDRLKSSTAWFQGQGGGGERQYTTYGGGHGPASDIHCSA